jgi:hypothetical protein
MYIARIIYDRKISCSISIFIYLKYSQGQDGTVAQSGGRQGILDSVVAPGAA